MKLTFNQKGKTVHSNQPDNNKHHTSSSHDDSQVVISPSDEKEAKINKIMGVVTVVVLLVGGSVSYAFWQNYNDNLDSLASSSLHTIPSCDSVKQATLKDDCINHSVEALVYRMYKGGLNREPDTEGFNYWINSIMSSTQNPNSMSVSIINAAHPPQQSNGSTTVQLTNEEFVVRAYQRILGRQPDASGKSYWINRLNNHTATRDYVIAFFANKANISKAQAIQRMGSLTKNIKDPATKYYPTFVTSLYKNLLGRTPDKAGLDFWVSRLENGQSYASVLYTFAMQGEAINHNASSFAAFVKKSPPKYTYNSNQSNSGSDNNRPNNSGSSGGSSSSGSSDNGNSSSSNGSGSSSSQNNKDNNPYACNPPYPTIRDGSKDNSGGRKDKCVSAVQWALKYGAGQPLKVDGVVGKSTISAIRNFQRFFKAPVTGIMTPAQVAVANKISRFAGNTDNGGGNDNGGSGSSSDSGSDSGSGSSGGTTESSSPNWDSSHFKILIVGLGVNDPSTTKNFKRAVDGFKDVIRMVDPYASLENSNKLAIKAVTLPDDYGCYTSIYSMSKVCAEAFKAIDSDYVYDRLVLITAKSQRSNEQLGGATYLNDTKSLVSYASSTRPKIILHEMGHSFGLMDEYVYADFSSLPKGAYDVYRVPAGQPYYQCSSAKPPADWKTEPGPWSVFKNDNVQQWYQGCGFDDYYRSIDAGLMSDIRSQASYGPTGEPMVNKAIDSIVPR